MYPIVYLSYTMDLLPKLYIREDLLSCNKFKILSKYPSLVYLSYTMDLLPKLYTREDLMSCKQVQDFK